MHTKEYMGSHRLIRGVDRVCWAGQTAEDLCARRIRSHVVMYEDMTRAIDVNIDVTHAH